MNFHKLKVLAFGCTSKVSGINIITLFPNSLGSKFNSLLIVFRLDRHSFVNSRLQNLVAI